MAPRKRTTKQAKNDPKMTKLESFLEDFDSEVNVRVAQMKKELSLLVNEVDYGYKMALIKLPKSIRKMNWIELCQSEKPKSPEVNDSKRQEEVAIIESVVAEDHAVLLKTVQKTSKKKAGAKSSSQDENTPNATRKTKATRKPPTTSKRAKALSINKQNTSIRRSNRKPLVTPAKSMLDSSLMIGPTPLITPRFDPRLPKTPAVRPPCHKERVYSISVNGSPISAGSDDVFINVPMGNGESIQLLASQLNAVDLSLLDETALRSIRQLQNRLQALCGPTE